MPLAALETPELTQPTSTPAGVPTTTARILVVDDEPKHRANLAQLLHRHGFEAVEAVSGIDAIQQVENEAFDLVLLDIAMPDPDGFEVLRVLRQRASESDLPVIMVADDAASEQIVQAFQSGANDFVTKPVDAGVAVARIRTQLKLKESQAALRRSEERYSRVTQGTNDGLWDWDLATDQVYYSPRWLAMLGLDEGEAAPLPAAWLTRIHTEDRPHVDAELDKHFQGITPQFETELRMRHADGSFRWMLCRGLAERDADGRAQRMAGSLTDITEGKVADALTGLPNRVLFLDRLRRCVERKRRDPSFTFALLYLDLDNFKLVNDSLGHDYGDRLLVSLARRLEGSVRSTDSFVSRLGGDEFAVLLEEIGSAEEAQSVAKRILEGVSAPISVGGGREVFASISVGISMASDDFDDGTDMLQEADTAMYHAKAAGKGRFQVFNPAMKERVTRRLEIENALRHAVEGRDFTLHYQPIVSVGDGKLVGFEALVRWNHAEMGMVSPSDFVPVAEDTGLIVPIGNWVLHEACRQMAEWKAVDPRFADVTIAVNLSSRQISQPEIVAEVVSVLAKTGLPARDLKLEITESAIMENPEACADRLSELREFGVKVAIDDFGTGYSSLAYLHRLPLDALKIDRSFVDKMTLTDDNLAIVSTILALADHLQLDVVAEGIETTEQRRRLDAMGCQFAQGYFFSRPIPGEMVLDAEPFDLGER